MRTVTFSDAEVAAALSKDFVCTWKNIQPEKTFGEGTNKALDKLRASGTGDVLPQGTGDTNICAVFALADGRIVHAVPGYARAGTFLSEVAFAVAAARAAREENAQEKLKALYEQRLKDDPEKRGAIGTALRSLAASPLPSIDRLLDAKRAGLR